MSAARKTALAAAVAITLAGCSAPVGHLTTSHRPPTTTTTAATPPGGNVITNPGPTTTVPPTPVAAPSARLVAYGGCPALLSQLHNEALAEVTPYGLVTTGSMEGAPVATGAPAASAGGASSGGASSGAATAAPSSGTAAGSPSPNGAGTGYSTTNNQEAGVDEPDLAKTDGQLMVIVRHNPMGLQVVDVSTHSPHLDGFLPLSQLGGSGELFLVGHDAVVIGTAAYQPQPGPQPYQSQPGPGYSGPAQPAPGPQPTPQTIAVVVSLDNPQHPTVTRSFSLDGNEVGSRLVGGRVLLVLQGSPRLPFTYPRDSSGAEQQRALAANRTVVRRSTLGQWLPSAGAAGGPRQLARCQAVLHPVVASGLGTVSVVSLDPSSSLPGPEVTIVGNASVVYASTTAMYLATTSWQDQLDAQQGDAQSVHTDIHGFDLSVPGAPRYIGSGWVDGTLTDQYAMSEYNGALRVATTVGQAYTPGPQPMSGDQTAPAQPAPGPNPQPQPGPPSDNLVTVLQPVAGALVPVGQITGLGRGERIYGVRFVGPLGYVVTFRQTDPLYVIDLADPRHPVLRGQIQLDGFSAYLQPLGGGKLFGIGQEVGQQPGGSGEGVQVSVFDVSDPTHPLLNARHYYDSAYSSAEQDHHAFLWWQPRGMVIVPLSQYSSNQPFQGELVLRVGAAGSLTDIGRISQPAPQYQSGGSGGSSGGSAGGAAPPNGGGTMMAPYNPGIERALVVGSLIYTVSENGVMANNIDSLAQTAWLPYQ